MNSFSHPHFGSTWYCIQAKHQETVRYNAAMLESQRRGIPLRVFRSALDDADNPYKSGRQVYVYQGLFKIEGHEVQIVGRHKLKMLVFTLKKLGQPLPLARVSGFRVS